MDAADYEKQLFALLGVRGPVGELPQPNGEIKLVYRLPDGSKKYLMPSDKLNCEQRADQIDELRRHLGVIRENRSKSSDC